MEGLDENLLFDMKTKEVIIANQTLPCLKEYEPVELTEEEDTEDNEISIEEELANVGKGVKNLFSSIYKKLQ